MFLLTAKKKFIRNLTILTLGISVLTLLVFHMFFREYYFVCYPFIPLYFYLCGLLFIHVSLFVYRYNEDKILSTVLLYRGIKFFFSIVAVVACGLVDRKHIVSLGLVFVVYYLAYLAFETCFYVRLEQEKKQK